MQGVMLGRLRSDWSAGRPFRKVGWRFSFRDSGEQSVTTTGTRKMPRWSVGSWVSLPTVPSPSNMPTLERSVYFLLSVHIFARPVKNFGGNLINCAVGAQNYVLSGSTLISFLGQNLHDLLRYFFRWT